MSRYASKLVNDYFVANSRALTAASVRHFTHLIEVADGCFALVIRNLA
jgi:hypothetical protein